MFQKPSGIRTVYENEGGWGGAKGGTMEYHEFPSENCGLTLPKNFVKETFGVSKSFRYGKILCISGVYRNFLSNVF